MSYYDEVHYERQMNAAYERDERETEVMFCRNCGKHVKHDRHTGKCFACRGIPKTQQIKCNMCSRVFDITPKQPDCYIQITCDDCMNRMGDDMGGDYES